MMPAYALVRFESDGHRYTNPATGAVLPSITQMLQRTGHVDPTWYTEESCFRGTAVHELTKAYDLDALDPATCRSAYRGWLLAHVAARQILRPTILKVEEVMAHPGFHYAGRPDRIVKMSGLRAVLEIKSGAEEPAHRFQTALQAMLESVECGIPYTALARFALYLKGTGQFKLIQHRERRDFDEAHRMIRACCR